MPVYGRVGGLKTRVLNMRGHEQRLFFRRGPHQRIPANFHNFAFLGQFCEVADDTVFTVEYSVRTAQTAVYGLLDLPRALTPIYRGNRDLGVVLRALRALA